MNKNDTRILELKKAIEEKYVEIGDGSKFSPQTTCIIQFGLIKINLHTLSVNDLRTVMTILKCIRTHGDSGITICGFSIRQWLDDIYQLIEKKETSELRKQLKVSEKKLNSLLSEDKRTEIELDSIAALLGHTEGG